MKFVENPKELANNSKLCFNLLKNKNQRKKNILKNTTESII